MLQPVKTIYTQHNFERVLQGDIYKDIEYPILETDEKNAVNKLKLITTQYLVVLSQDCDLEQDYKDRSNENGKQDKHLDYILAIPLFLASSLKNGTHLSDLGYISESFGSKDWDKIASNQNSRYHYLMLYEEFQVPELVADFKRYVTIPRSVLYSLRTSKYLATMDTLFRENMSQRFANYFSRIGLPEVLPKETSSIN
jgi:hypothetical protein